MDPLEKTKGVANHPTVGDASKQIIKPPSVESVQKDQAKPKKSVFKRLGNVGINLLGLATATIFLPIALPLVIGLALFVPVGVPLIFGIYCLVHFLKEGGGNVLLAVPKDKQDSHSISSLPLISTLSLLTKIKNKI